MRLKHLTALVAIPVIGLSFTLTAQANPRFTVENNLDVTVDVTVFNGGDASCSTPAKAKTVDAGKTGSFGCMGNGKGKCKIVLGIDGDRICKSKQNTCSGKAIKVKGGKTVSISENNDGGHVCEIH